MGAIDAVCFDLDSTLCVPEQTDEAIHEAVFERVDCDPFFTPADVRDVDPDDLPTAESDREYYEFMYREIAGDDHPNADEIPDLATATVEVVDPTAVRFREGARDVLEYARDHYDVGLITNGSVKRQSAKLERLGIDDAFDVAVFADPAKGIEPKPDPAPFGTALDALDAAPERTLYVGNWHAGDVVGAHAAGLQSVWVPYERPHESIPEDPEPAPGYRLDSMADLRSIL